MSNGKLERDEILDPSIPQAVIDLNGNIQTLAQSFRDLQSAAKNLDIKVSGGSGISDLTNGIKSVVDSSNALQGKSKNISDLTVAVSEYNKMLSQTATVEAKLSVATSDEIKTYYAKQAALAETTKALRAEAAASTDGAQAAVAKKQADMDAAAAEKERVAQAKAQAQAQVAATKAQKDAELATRVLQKALDDMNAQKAKEQALLDKNSNAYETLKREYNEAAYATKTLAAEYVILQREGTASADTLATMSKRLKDQQVATLGQSNALLQMEQAVGQNQRSVGNYANATGEITQILRELPNFAISAQTGILSLSNNVPMLQAALSRLAQTTDVNTGKAVGWAGVLKTLGSTIFSTQGLIVLLTTLMVAFGDQLLKAIDFSTNAEKAQKNYNDALKDTTKELSGELGELTRLQAVIESTTASRTDQITAINELQQKYPNFFADIQNEAYLVGTVNQRIQEQIDLLNRRAEDKAAETAITKATEDLTAAQLELNESISPWQKFWAARPWGAKPYDELSTGAKAAIDAQYKLYQQGVISKDEYNVMYRRLQDVSNAQDILTESVKRSISPQQDKIDKIDAEIKEQEKLIDHYKQVINEYGPQMSGQAAQEVSDREKIIKALQEQRVGYAKAAEARDSLDTRKEAPNVTNADIDVQEWQGRVDAAKKGSKQIMDTEIGLAHAVYNQRLQQIEIEKEQYKDDVQRDLYVSHQKVEAQNDLNKALNKAKEDYKPSTFDSTSIDLEAAQRVFVAQQAIEKEQLETTNAHLATIYENETKSLDMRLAAYDQYVLNLQALEDNQFKTDQHEREDQLAKIAEIEKRTSLVLTDSNKEQIDQSKDLTSQEKTLLHEKVAIQAELESATLTHNDKLLAINDDAQKKEQQIIKNSITYQVKLQTDAFKDIQDETKGQTAIALANLEAQRQAGTISEKNFWLTRQNIVSGESKLLYQKEIEFLTDRKDAVIKQLDNPDIPEADRKSLEALKDNLNKAFGELVKQTPQPKKTQSRSILSYLGLAPDQDAIDIENALQAYQASITNYDKITRDEADTVAQAQKYAKDKFGEGSKEYGDIVKMTEAEFVTLLEQAGVDRDAAYKAYQELLLKQAENMKQIITKAAEDLAKNTLKAFETIGENQSKGRIDALDAETAAIQTNLDAQLAANDASSDSDAEKADNEAKLKAKAAADDARIATAKKAEQRNQAIAAKRNALFEAALNGSIAISKIIATYSANPILEGVLIALAIASIGVNIAAISSQQIPSYWQGTPVEGHKGGPANVGEHGAELGILPSGQMFLTPGITTQMDLPRGTHIIPHEKLAEATDKMNVRELRGLKDSADYQTQMLIGLMIEQSMAKTSKQITEAIINKQETHFNWHNGELQKAIMKGHSRTEWLGGL